MNMINFYAMLSGITINFILRRNSKGYFSKDYPKNKKNIAIFICSKIASFSTVTLLTYLL